MQSVDVKTVNLVNEFGIEEKWPQYCGQQIICSIVSSERVKKYWKRPVYLPLLDIAFSEIKPRSVQKRG